MQFFLCKIVTTAIFSIFFVIIPSLPFSQGAEDSKNLLIMDSSVDVDEYATYDVSTCNSNFHPGIISLWMKGLDCVNIYPASDCTGWFIRLTLLGFPHYWLNTYRWIGEEMIKENLQIGSAGPCFDKCDARNWQGDRIEAVHVTLYDKTEFRGNLIILWNKALQQMLRRGESSAFSFNLTLGSYVQNFKPLSFRSKVIGPIDG